MKRTLTFLLLFLSFSAFSQISKEDSLINRLSKKIAASQYYYTPQAYKEIAYIREEYNVPNLLKNDSVFIKRLSDYYYKQFYAYGKLLNRNFSISEDCITGEDNEKTLDAYKLLMYSLYEDIKLPVDYFKRLETASKEDNPFLSEYFALNTIYFLKRFRGNTLTTFQISQLKALEKSLSDKMYKDYIVNKPWSFYKLCALKVLKINKNPLVKNVDLTPVIDYYLQQGSPETNIYDINLVDEDQKDFFLANNLGMDKVRQFEAIALLWIILSDKN